MYIHSGYTCELSLVLYGTVAIQDLNSLKQLQQAFQSFRSKPLQPAIGTSQAQYKPQCKDNFDYLLLNPLKLKLDKLNSTVSGMLGMIDCMRSDCTVMYNHSSIL